MKSVWQTYDGQVKELREQGMTLQVIGNKFGVTRERIRQILVEHYGTTTIQLVTRVRLAKLLGCSYWKLAFLEKKGVLNPRNIGKYYFYDRDEMEKAALEVMRPRAPDVERICEICGTVKFYRPYEINPRSPGKFCSRRCQGVWTGRSFGFAAHPENRGKPIWQRKWDYDQVYKLREQKGWGARLIGRKLGIPEGTVTYILRKLYGTPVPRGLKKLKAYIKGNNQRSEGER